MSPGSVTFMLAIGKEIRYRIAAILDAHWEEFFQAEKRWIRPVVLETVRKIRACRTPALGCHVYACPDGHEIRIVPHSCKSRFCPTCGKHATDRWADGVLNDLLDVPYHDLVLSAPWQLRPIMSFNREVCLSILARAGSSCLNQWARDQHGMRMGIVTVIHTFGADIKWHPHLHLLVTEGGLSLDGERWIQPYNLGWLMSHAGLKKMWRYHVITAFRTAHKNGELRFPASSAFLYTKRAVLAEYRIARYDGKTVRFAFNDYAQGGKTSYKTLPVLAFIGRLVRHIPDKHFKMVRYSGLFATRWKRRYQELARRALGHDAPDEATAPDTEPTAETPPSLLGWAERRHAQDPDALRCLTCGKTMILREVAFGAHARIEELFRLGGYPVKAAHPAYAMPP